MTIVQYMTAVPNDITRTAISGLMARFGWEMASKYIHKAMIENADSQNVEASHTAGHKPETEGMK